MSTIYKLDYTAEEINKKLGEVVDQSYNPTSENSQSGLAVNEIITEVRNEIDNKCLQKELVTTTLPIAIKSGVVLKDLTVFGTSTSRYKHCVLNVAEGEKYLLTCYCVDSKHVGGILVNSADNSQLVILNDKNTGYIDEEVIIPSGYDTLYVNTFYHKTTHPLSVKKVEFIDNHVNVDDFNSVIEDYNVVSEELNRAKFDIENLERRATKLEKLHDFCWGEFDKPYFVFVCDDTNGTTVDAYNAFHSKNVPLGIGAVIKKLETVYDEKTIKEWLQLIVADGGEILAHYNYDLKQTSTDEEWYEHFVMPKMVLNENGFEVRGALLANNSTPKCKKGEYYCRKYYDYADKIGTSLQYQLGRTLMSKSESLDGFKAHIDSCIMNNGLYAFCFHGNNRDDEAWITEESLKEIIDYVISKGGVITTYSNVFDTIGTTVLEKRLSALENA